MNIGRYWFLFRNVKKIKDVKRDLDYILEWNREKQWWEVREDFDERIEEVKNINEFIKEAQQYELFKDYTGFAYTTLLTSSPDRWHLQKANKVSCSRNVSRFKKSVKSLLDEAEEYRTRAYGFILLLTLLMPFAANYIPPFFVIDNRQKVENQSPTPQKGIAIEKHKPLYFSPSKFHTNCNSE